MVEFLTLIGVVIVFLSIAWACRKGERIDKVNKAEELRKMRDEGLKKRLKELGTEYCEMMARNGGSYDPETLIAVSRLGIKYDFGKTMRDL